MNENLTERDGRVFGRLQVRLDPWQPEFGPEFAAADESTAEAQESIDIELERSTADWSAIDPDPKWAGEHPVWFVDGVRRLEARVTAKLDGHFAYGAFGAYGVGAAQVDTDRACFERSLSERVFALSLAEQPAGEIGVAPGLTYIPLRVPENEPEAPVRAIHREMRQAEETLARELAADEGRLVVVDGPLTFEESTRGSAVGYIKRVINPYLLPRQLALLPRLDPGQRTPLFGLRGSNRFARISWFCDCLHCERAIQISPVSCVSKWPKR